MTGISHPSMRKAEAIVEAAEKEPEKFRHLVQEMDSTGRIDPVHRKLVKLQGRESECYDVKKPSPAGQANLKDDLRMPGQQPDSSTFPLPLRKKVFPSYEFAPAQPVPFIKRFDVILVNAPWERLGKGGYPFAAGVAIRGVPANVMASQDCIVWLRATNSHMQDAYFALSAWGFSPQTILTWVRPDAHEGDWLTDQTEHCIVAVAGNPPIRRDRMLTTVLVAPPKEGCDKPEGFYQLIEQMCLGQSRVEIFCEGPQEAWMSWTPCGVVEWFEEGFHREAPE